MPESSPAASGRPRGLLPVLLVCVLAIGLAVVLPRVVTPQESAGPAAIGAAIETNASTLSAGSMAPGRRPAGAGQVPGRSQVGFSPGFGILDASPAQLRRDLRGMREIGATRVRVDLSWARVQPRRGTFDWSATDRVFGAARAEGLKVLAILDYEPAWARRFDSAGALLPVDPRAFARFADKAARRYAPMVDAWEIWNEPNLVRFWPSGPDPTAYAALVDAVAPVLQRRDPRATVIAGAVAPGDDVADGSEMSPVTFMSGYYQAARKKRAVDAISVHPYSYPALPTGRQGFNTFNRLAKIRAVMRENGQRRQRIWLTEYGAPTGSHPRAVSTPRQGRMLTTAYRQVRKKGFLGPIFFYSFRDERAAPGDLESNFGIIRKNGTRKASYYSLARVLRAPNRKN